MLFQHSKELDCEQDYPELVSRSSKVHITIELENELYLYDTKSSHSGIHASRQGALCELRGQAR